MNDEHELVMPFWIDTDAYSARDRLMFCAGVEFEMVRAAIRDGWRGSRVVHRENESRLRMMCGKLCVACDIAQHEGYEGCEVWSEMAVK